MSINLIKDILADENLNDTESISEYYKSIYNAVEIDALVDAPVTEVGFSTKIYNALYNEVSSPSIDNATPNTDVARPINTTATALASDVYTEPATEPTVTYLSAPVVADVQISDLLGAIVKQSDLLASYSGRVQGLGGYSVASIESSSSSAINVGFDYAQDNLPLSTDKISIFW